MLLILNPKNKWHRVIRRAVVVGVLTFIAVLLRAILPETPEAVVPVIVAILAAIDKTVRDR